MERNGFRGFHAVRTIRCWAHGIVLGLTALALTACMGLGGQQPSLETAGSSDTIGEGDVTIALLLPTSASGSTGSIAQGMRNAAEMALSEMPSADIRLLPFDTGGSAQGAQQAATRAVAEETDLIIGPLFAREVQAVGQVARNANVPVIAFSTDANVAQPGVYLLSFMPEADVSRVVNYAAGNGRRAFSALLPRNSYGAVIEGAFQQAVSERGGRIVSIERYGTDPEEMQTAVGRIAAVAGGSQPQVDALLLPDTPSVVRALGPMLSATEVDPQRVQVLGSGQWNDETAWNIAELEGAWFAGPDPQGWESFQSRYADSYGAPPPRNATLAYDAVSLAAALSGLRGSEAFTQETLTNRDGFAGIDGVFRFRSDGTSERGLAILEIRDGAAEIRDPAPRRLGAGT